MDDVAWLLEGDPSIRWQTLRDLTGRAHFAVDEGEGTPSRWNTLRALRVLRWSERGDARL